MQIQKITGEVGKFADAETVNAVDIPSDDSVSSTSKNTFNKVLDVVINPYLEQNKENLLAKLVQDAPDHSIVLLDLDGTVLSWNRGAETIFGYSEAEALGSNFRVFYVSEDRELLLPDNQLEAAATHNSVSTDGWRVHKDGGKFWGSEVISALRDTHGNVCGFSSITRDFSKRKALEEKQRCLLSELEYKNEQLYRSEERFRRMISEVEEYAIILLDLDGNVLNWNKGAEKIKGYQSDEIVGHHFSRFYLQEDILAGVPQKLLDTARTLGKSSHEGWRLKKSGEVFWGSVVITALHGSDDQVTGYSKVTRDLTERKIAEEKQARYAVELQHKNELLRRSEERYHRMIAEVEDYAILLLDIDGSVLNWNRGAEKIKGYTEKEIVGQNFSVFYLEEDKESRLPEQLLETAVREGKSSHEGWRVRKDGSKFWANVVITALHNDTGQIIGFSKVTRDLTQKKRADEQILQKNKQLEEYAYVASHDLQEPLRKIQMFSYLLKESIDNKEAAERNLDKINAAAHRMSTLIADVLNYAQTENIAELFQPVDLNEIVSNVRNDFELLLEQRNGTVTIGELPVIRAIPVQMNQLFSNLISNSIKFNNREPQINISSQTHGPNSVSIIVEDNGTGFDPQYTEKIFKMFQRASSDRTGTGIGLALCKKIMENHGGSIQVSSAIDVGTRFELIFNLL